MDFNHAVIAAAQSKYMLAIISLIGIDFITGTISALRRGTFSWEHVGNVVPKNVFLGAVTASAQVFSAVREGSVDSILVGGGVFYVYAIAVSHSILENVDEITGLNLLSYVNLLAGVITRLLKKKNGPP